MNAAKPQSETVTRVKRADDVVGDSRSHVGDFTERFFRMIRMPVVKCFASLLEFLLVELMEPGHEFGHRIERRRGGSCGRRGSGGSRHSCGLLRQAYCRCEKQNERQCASVV